MPVAIYCIKDTLAQPKPAKHMKSDRQIAEERGDQTRYDKMLRETKKGKMNWGDVLICQIKARLKESEKNLNKIASDQLTFLLYV